MNIQDIMRGLPFPVQGAIMQMYGMTGNQQPQQNAGAGRGFVNPPLVNPNAAPPQMPRVQPSRSMQVPKDEAGFEDVIKRIMAGSSTDELQNAPAVEAPTPVQQAMEPDLPAPTAQEAASPMQQAAGNDSPGILGYLDKAVGFSRPDFVGRLGTALAVAGSQDPTKALMQVQQQRGEEAKIAEARRRANQPKVEPIAGTPFFQVTYPDGRMETVNNPALAAYYKAQGEGKQNDKIEAAVLADRLARTRDVAKADIKASEEAKPLLNDIQGLKGRWAQAKEIVSGQGTMAQVQGIPGIAGIAGFFGGDEVAKNKFLEGLTVDETLLNTARTKGAISNQEMMLFKSPIPSLTDDREKVWKPWIEQRLAVLDKMEKFQAGEVARAPSTGGAAAPASSTTAAPAGAAETPNANAIRTQAAASFGAYEPNKYEYRMGPNGLQRRLKGQ